jgi:hypothetical protein
LVQNPIETFTNVVQSATAKGQLPGLLLAGKQRSTFRVFDSSCSDTAVAVEDIWKGRHGLHEYTMLLVDDSTDCSLKTANRGSAQLMRLPLNECDSEFCNNIKALPVESKEATLPDGGI